MQTKSGAQPETIPHERKVSAMAMTAPRMFAETYVETINREAYGELRNLFAVNAVFLGPGQQEFHGRDEIGTFYERFLGEMRPIISIVSYVEDGDDCVYELQARRADGGEPWLAAIDHATVDADGKVARFTVFTK
jgi:SnoaL-like domain